MNANVYVDGFNLYRTRLKGTPYKWLDLHQLAAKLLPNYRVNRVRYFTAYIHPSQDDPRQLHRQLIYLRALKTLPNLSIHLGQFRTTEYWGRPVDPIPHAPDLIRFRTRREKGSDVNLATYLLLDAANNDYDVAAIISNDSDLCEPIRVVQERFRKPVLILCPALHPSKKLSNVATFCKPIRESVIRDSQFPSVLSDQQGRITKPREWGVEGTPAS